jgi:DNA invertase Pin-like site-specific DNA recombinase
LSAGPPGFRDAGLNVLIGYRRVSLEEQARSGLGLDAQRDAIERYAMARGKSIIWIEDEGISAKSMKRPGLQTALWMLENGDAGGIIASRLDRLSRSVSDFTDLLEKSRKQKWGIVVLDFDLDTTTAAGRMLAGVMMQFSQFERELIGERTSAALKAAQARGIHVGRPVTLSRAAESRVLQLRADGLSFARVAAQLNSEKVATAHGGVAWHATTVARILKRRAREVS